MRLESQEETNALFFHSGDDNRQAAEAICEKLGYKMADITLPGASTLDRFWIASSKKNEEEKEERTFKKHLNASSVFAGLFMPELITRIRTAKVDKTEKDGNEKDFFEQLEAICVDGTERSRLSKRWIDKDIWRLARDCVDEATQNITFEEQQSKVVEMLYAKDRCFTGEGLDGRPRWEPAVYLRIGQNPRPEPKHEKFGFIHVRPVVENWETDFREPETEARFTVVHIVSQGDKPEDDPKYGESIGALLLLHRKQDRSALSQYIASKKIEDDREELEDEAREERRMELDGSITSIVVKLSVDGQDFQEEKKLADLLETSFDDLKERARQLIYPESDKQIEVKEIKITKVTKVSGQELDEPKILDERRPVKECLGEEEWTTVSEIEFSITTFIFTERKSADEQPQQEERPEPAKMPSPYQMDVAARILGRVKFVFKEQGRDLSSFKNTKYVIWLPPQETLKQQTKEREEYLHFYFPGCDDPDRTCFMLTERFIKKPSRRLDHKEILRLRQEVKDEKNQDVLFVMIFDESHWGIGKGGAHDSILNDNDLLESENVMALLVSATPYNNLTCDSRIPERYVKIDDDAEGRHTRVVSEKAGEKVWNGPGKSHSSVRPSDREQLHVIKWFPNATPQKRTEYLRMENYLQSVYSQLRHGRCGAPDPEVRGGSDWSLIRADPSLDKLMTMTSIVLKGTHKDGVSENVWLADFLFEMVYLCKVHWDPEEKKLSNDCWKKKLTTLGAIDPIKIVQMEKDICAAFKDLCDELFPKFKKMYDQETRSERFLTDAQWKVIYGIRIAVLQEDGEPEGSWLKLKLEELSKGLSRTGSTSETELILRDLLDWDSGHMKMVRISADIHAATLRVGLRFCRDKFFQVSGKKPSVPFAVIMDTGKTPLYIALESEPEFLDFKLEGGKTIRSVQDEKKKKLLYEDLGGLSCILLLVDKGRKGDTFPQVSVLCVNICACERSSVRTRKHIYLCIKLIGGASGVRTQIQAKATFISCIRSKGCAHTQTCQNDC